MILEVDRDRDGRSFSARRVVAIQDGEVIFSMVTSFHVETEEGTRFDDAPRRDVPAPEDTTLGGWNPLLDVRPVTPTDFLKGVFTDCLWVKSAVSLGDDPLVHRAGLTYLSDLGTGFGQQDRKLIGRGGPSIDHSVWFQEDIRADEWVLVDLRPVKARSARGAYHGSLRDRDGALGCHHLSGTAAAAGLGGRPAGGRVPRRRGPGRRRVATPRTRPSVRRREESIRGRLSG